VALCVVPFAFLKWGGRMRERSQFCQYLRMKKREEEEAVRKERAGEKEEAARVRPEEVKGKEDV
jgi:hypothetical protein